MKKKIEEAIEAVDAAEEALHDCLSDIYKWLKEHNSWYSYTESVESGSKHLTINYRDNDGDHCYLYIPWQFLQDGFDSEGFDAYLEEKEVAATREAERLTAEREHKELDRLMKKWGK